eukprot:12167354-Prorocentrum_lima.AAC.1
MSVRHVPSTTDRTPVAAVALVARMRPIRRRGHKVPSRNTAILTPAEEIAMCSANECTEPLSLLLQG